MADNNENIAEEPVKAEEIKEEPVVAAETEQKAAETIAVSAAATAAAADAASKAKEEKKAAEAAQKAAKKAAAKAEKDAKKAAAKAEKRRIKREKQQAIIDACPPEYKAMSTAKYFWFGVLCYLPAIGFFITILMSLIPRNRNLKHFARAILINYIIIAVVFAVLVLISYFAVGEGPRDLILDGMETILSSFGI